MQRGFLFDAFRPLSVRMSCYQKLPTLIDYLRNRVIDQDQRPALVGNTHHRENVSLNWLELGRVVSSMSAWIASNPRIEKRETNCVGYRCENSIGSVVTALACMNLGLIEFPFDQRLGDAEIKKRWDPIGGLWLTSDIIEKQIHCESGIPDLSSLLRDRKHSADSPALVLWTSGTTGKPKGVTLSGNNLLGNALAKLKAAPQDLDDRRLCVLPLCHGYARTCDLGTWLISGCTLVVSLGYQGIQKYAPRVRPTLMNLVPSLASRLLKECNIDGLQELKLLGCGGAALSRDDYLQWSMNRGVTVIQGYGLTETAPVICSATPQKNACGLVGDFVEGWEHKIVSKQLYVRGPHVMLGYWNDPEATNAKIDSEGWLATGDEVEIDPATNQIKVLGRVDEVIVLDNAVKIHPRTIEQIVDTIEGISRSILIYQRSLQLWIDLQDQQTTIIDHQELIREQVAAVVGTNIGGHPYSVHFFSHRLEGNEITSKGTTRRAQIIKNRFET